MRINRKLLPIKMHFFFFMAAMGPILPQIQVYGKDLGISSLVMGTVTGILPFTFLLVKPIFGLIVDIYRNCRKTIFILLIIIMICSFAGIYFIPRRPLVHFSYQQQSPLKVCNNSLIMRMESQCTSNSSFEVTCSSPCLDFPKRFQAFKPENEQTFQICVSSNESVVLNRKNCVFSCEETANACLYRSFTFWSFILLMSLGTIGYNVINSITDAICFDVVGVEYDYGKQRVWGTIGFGLAALISGYVIDIYSTYTPAFVIMLLFALFDIFSCFKLKLPAIPPPENIFRDLKQIFINANVIVFFTFTVFAGAIDSIIVYYLFWYLEDLATDTNTSNVKLLEGLIVAAETLGGEVVFFSLSGKIINYLGHVNCFTICFINYSLRFLLIAMAPSPWWILPVEFFMQGPTYALTYTTIVAYANHLAPPGMSATMQGIAAGMSEGTGYAIGSILGGLSYKLVKGQLTFKIFSIFALSCGCIHMILSRIRIMQHTERNLYERIL